MTDLAGGVVFVGSTLASLRRSVEELNVKMAQAIERMTFHEKRLDRHESKIERLETRE